MVEAMSKATELVYLSTKAKADKRYHENRRCDNIPERIKEVSKAEIKDHYHACSMCVDGADPDEYAAKKNPYACAECGRRILAQSEAVRKLHPCNRCNDVTNHERQ
jgi:predicted RNA-binding Zn-ribbon protein involved in translation (DUF1610 family)